jgi:aryl-alcohol dehydrogenase-like predicted oxidoreductase
MEYRRLGNTGLEVSRICLGCMSYGNPNAALPGEPSRWQWALPESEARPFFKRALELGINFFDTANVYSLGASEEVTGRALKELTRREDVVIATKVWGVMRNGPNGSGLSRKAIFGELDASLKRLGTDYVDVYWVHAWDFMTPVDEVMRALDDMVRAGKVLYVGISDAPAWIVSQANTLADLKGWSPFVCLQIQYSLIERTAERELLPMAKALDVAATAGGPLGGGTLTGKYKRAADRPKETRFAEGTWGDAFLTDRNFTIAEEVEKVAGEVGRTPSQVAIAWLRQRKDSGVIVPIVGARKLSQVQDNLAALKLVLTDEQLARLDEVSAIQLGFPHDFLRSDGVRQVIYGNTYSRIDNHRR